MIAKPTYFGQDELDNLARQTGEQQSLDMQGIWNTIPVNLELRSLTSWLYTLTIVLVLSEVLGRRTGYLGQMLSVLRYGNPSNQTRARQLLAERMREQEHWNKESANDGPERARKSAGWLSAMARIATFGVNG